MKWDDETYQLQDALATACDTAGRIAGSVEFDAEGRAAFGAIAQLIAALSNDVMRARESQRARRERTATP